VQKGLILDRFGQLAEQAGWPQALGALRAVSSPEEVTERLADVVRAATAGYLRHGQASPVLLVHTATAPNAVLHTLPALPVELWEPSLAAVWAVGAAITAAYAPAEAAPRGELPDAPGGDDPVAEAIGRAVAHGDEHVIKLTDTAVDAYTASGDADTLAAAVRVGKLIRSPRR